MPVSGKVSGEILCFNLKNVLADVTFCITFWINYFSDITVDITSPSMNITEGDNFTVCVQLTNGTLDQNVSVLIRQSLTNNSKF